MSSLSEQLERARQNGTAARDRASFLFSTKDAEHIDSETVANLAANGLAELIKFDSRFARFESVLFSQSSRHFDRERQTTETNAAIDAHIEAFLLLLTGHFLDRSAHKTLEFLVRRYHVHRHNVDAIVRCMLPSHDSRAFGRMARILQFHAAGTSNASASSKWRFVGTARESGGSSAELGLGRKALAERCLSDGSIFAAVLGLARCACQGAPGDGVAKEGSAKKRRRSSSGDVDSEGNVDGLFALDRGASSVAPDQMEMDDSGSRDMAEGGRDGAISQLTRAGVSRVSTLFGALCLEILSRATTVTEDLLRQLIPTLVLAMGAGRSAPEMHAAALTVAARMCARTDVVLGFKPQTNLQLALVKSCCAGVDVSGGLLCLASLVHATETHTSAGNAKLLAQKVITRLERLSGLGELLATLSQSHDVGALVRALFCVLPARLWKPNKMSGAGALLLDMVKNGPESVVADCARSLTAALVSERGQHSSVSDDDDDVVDDMDTTIADRPVAVSRQLLLALAARFPGQTEQGLTDVLGGCKRALGKRSAGDLLDADAEMEDGAQAAGVQKRHKGNDTADSTSDTPSPAAAALFAFVSRTFSLASGSVRHVPLGDTGTTLLLALNGQDPILRCSALKEAARIVSEYDSDDTVSGSIVHDLYRPVLRRLRDDDASVVCCACSDALRPLLVRSGVRSVAEEVGRTWFVWAPRSRSQSSASDVRVQARNVLRSLLSVLMDLVKADEAATEDGVGMRQMLAGVLFDALPQPHSEHGVRLIHRDAVRCAARIGCGLFAAFDEIEARLDATNKRSKSKAKAKTSKHGKSAKGESMGAADLSELTITVMAKNVAADAQTGNEDGALEQLVAIASDRARWHSRQLALRVLVGALDACNASVAEAPDTLVAALCNELREEWASLETISSSVANHGAHIEFLSTAWACTIQHLSSPTTVQVDSTDGGEDDGKALELASVFPVLDCTCVQLLAVLLSTPTQLQAAAQPHVRTMCATLLQARPLPTLALIYGHPLKGAGILPRAAARGLLLTSTALRAAKDNPTAALACDVESVLPVLLATLPHRDVANRRAVLACFGAVSELTAVADLPDDIVYLAKSLVASTNMLLTNQGNAKRCVLSMLMPPSSQTTKEPSASRAAREALQLRLVSAVSAHLGSWESLALRLLNLVQAACWEPAVRNTSARLLARLLRQFQETGCTLSPSHYKVVRMLLQTFSWCDDSPASVFDTGLLALSCGWASNGDVPSVPSPQALALKRLNTQSVSALAPERQDAVVSALLHELGTANHDIATAVHAVLRSLPADGIVSNVSSQLQSCLDEGDAYANETAMLSDAGVGWIQKQAALLEVLQFGDMTGMSAETRQSLFGTLCGLLEAFTVPARSMAVGIEFAKQLVLGAFERYIQAISADGAVVSQSAEAQKKRQKKSQKKKKKQESTAGSAEAKSVSLVVTIARETSNPQTRSAALVVLSLVAKCWPQHVLCTLRPIFSCIGDVIAGDGSTFAFNVIHQILKTMIPPIRDLEKETNGTQLQEFVQEMLASLQQVPSERRLNLMSNLVEAILPTSLNAVIFLLLQQHHAGRAGGVEDVDRVGTFDRQAFAHALTLRFGARVQVFVLARLVNDAMVLLRHAVPAADDDEIPPIEEEMSPAVQLQMADQCTGVKEAFALCTKVLQFVTEHIASQQFHFKLLSLSEFKREELQEEYLELFQGVLLFVECTSQRQGDAADLLPNAWQQQVSDERRRSWLAQCQRASMDVLENVQRLLSMPAFVTMLQQLMESDNQHVRNKAMMLLNDKVTKQRDELNHVEQRLLVDMVSDLQPLLRKQAASDATGSAVDVQTVLVCIDTLARAFASSFTDIFEPVIPDVLHIVAGSSFENDSQVLSCCLFCLTALCSKISASMVPHLPRLVPRALDTLEWCLNALPGADVAASQATMALQTSALSFVEVVLDKLPHFLHSSVQRIALYLCSPDMLRSPNKAVRALATQVGRSLASRTEPRITVPALLQCSAQHLGDAQADTHGGNCQRKALELLEQTIVAMQPLDVERYHGELFDHFLCVMNDPALFTGAADDDANVAHTAEEAALVFSGSFMSLVMRLNEAQLRPLFRKMCDWEAADAERRSAPFFFVVKLLVSRLKSIFVPFFASIMGRCVAALGPDSDVQHGSLVVRWVLQALQQCFVHDSDGFTTDERFQMLEPALLGQIEHADTAMRDETEYKSFVEDVLSPCVVQLAVAVNNEQAWRQLNRNVLMKTRKPTPVVRFAALRITQELFKTLGEDFMQMLPESIPFLSELMEDESEDVETLCQRLMKELEEISGEKLDEYLE